jgi:hypothetical protein
MGTAIVRHHRPRLPGVSEHAHQEDEAALCPRSFPSGWAASPARCWAGKAHMVAAGDSSTGIRHGLTAYRLLHKACVLESALWGCRFSWGRAGLPAGVLVDARHCNLLRGLDVLAGNAGMCRRARRGRSPAWPPRREPPASGVREPRIRLACLRVGGVGMGAPGLANHPHGVGQRPRQRQQVSENTAAKEAARGSGEAPRLHHSGGTANPTSR